MKIILRKNVEKLGLNGDLKNVAAGYARNFLFPRKLALPATPEALRWFEKGLEKRQKRREAELQQARALAERISGTALSFTRTVGAQGRLFGSVGRSDIAASLRASGFSVDKNAVVLNAAIKEVGDFEVEIRLHSEATTKIKVSVLARS
ncbi:MAG: 50S ribosomal protein L9 [Elusimicrobia bacterium]|nr:50S ribosomal protein L9 [Elusimicrobiota bacterium]